MPFFQDGTDCSLLRKVVGTKVQPSMKGLQYKPVLSSSQDGFELFRSCQRDADLIIWLFLFPRVVRSFTSEAQLLLEDGNKNLLLCALLLPCSSYMCPAGGAIRTSTFSRNHPILSGLLQVIM